MLQGGRKDAGIYLGKVTFNTFVVKRKPRIAGVTIERVLVRAFEQLNEKRHKLFPLLLSELVPVGAKTTPRYLLSIESR